MANGLGFRDRFGNFWVNHRRKVLGAGVLAAATAGGIYTYNAVKKPEHDTTHDKIIMQESKDDPNKKIQQTGEIGVIHPASSQRSRPILSLEGEIRCYREIRDGTALRELRMNPRINLEEGADEGLVYDDLVLRAEDVYRCAVSNKSEWIGHNFVFNKDRRYVTMEAEFGDGDDGIYPVRSFDLSKEAAGFEVDGEGKYGSVRFAVGRLHPGSYTLNVPVFEKTADPKTGEALDGYIGDAKIRFRIGDLQEVAADTSPKDQRVIGERRRVTVSGGLPAFGESWFDNNL